MQQYNLKVWSAQGYERLVKRQLQIQWSPDGIGWSQLHIPRINACSSPIGRPILLAYGCGIKKDFGDLWKAVWDSHGDRLTAASIDYNCVSFTSTLSIKPWDGHHYRLMIDRKSDLRHAAIYLEKVSPRKNLGGSWKAVADFKMDGHIRSSGRNCVSSRTGLVNY